MSLFVILQRDGRIYPYTEAERSRGSIAGEA